MVTQATVFITLVGICWAVAMWVPFAIIMEVCNQSNSLHDINISAVLKGSFDTEDICTIPKAIS